MNGRRDELLDSKDETISILRGQLREEQEARRRADNIIEQLTQSNSRLSDRVLALETPAQEVLAPEPREEAAQGVAESAPGRVSRSDGVLDQNAPAPAVKSSRQVVTETVTSGLILAAALALAKVLLPAIVAVGAFVVASLTAINGESLSSAISAIVGFLSVFVVYFQLRTLWRQNREASPFEYRFSEDSWTEREGGDFALEIPKSEHGKGENPTAFVYEPTSEGGYAEVVVEVRTRPSGAVLLGADERFAGKVVVR